MTALVVDREILKKAATAVLVTFVVAAKRAVADAAVTVSVAPLLSAVAGSRSEVVEPGEVMLVSLVASLRILMSIHHQN